MKMVIALVLVMSSSFAQAKSVRVQKCAKKRGSKSVVCAFKTVPVAAAPTENCYFSTEQAATICTAVLAPGVMPHGGIPRDENCHFNNEQAATICDYPAQVNKPAGTTVTGLPFGSEAASSDNCRKDWESALTVCN